jgi:hypothetical protein
MVKLKYENKNMKRLFLQFLKQLRFNFERLPQEIINIIFILGFCLIIISFLSSFFTLIGLLFLVYFVFSLRSPKRIINSSGSLKIITPRDGFVEKITDGLPPKVAGLSEKMQKVKITARFNDTNFILSPIKGKVLKAIPFSNEVFNSSKNNDGILIVFAPQEEQQILLTINYSIFNHKIINLVKENAEVDFGQLLAYSLIGGSVELYLPYSFELSIRLNQTLIAGETIIAEKVGERKASSKVVKKSPPKLN